MVALHAPGDQSSQPRILSVSPATVPDRLFGIFRHNFLSSAFGGLMLDDKPLGVRQRPTRIRPRSWTVLISTMRTASMTGRGRSTPKRRGGRRSKRTPEFLLRGQQEMLVERIGRDRISTHLPPPVITESAASLELVTHMLCWSWGMCFSAAAFSENDQGSMNLASKTAPLPATMPSMVAPIHRSTGCGSRCSTHSMVCPVFRSYQFRLRASVTTWVMKGVRRTLEAGWEVFIDENGGAGPGVRLRKPHEAGL